jgi:hypothetical protein
VIAWFSGILPPKRDRGWLNFPVPGADILINSVNNKNIQVSTMRERRLYPRFDVILPVKLSVGEQTVEGNIFDISMGGMQLGCDQASAEVLVPTPNQIVNPGQNLVVQASFRCPDGEGVIAQCRLVVSRRVSSNEFRIGMEIMDFDNDGDRETYEAYIRERMAEVA